MRQIRLEPVDALSLRWRLKALESSLYSDFLGFYDYSACESLYEKCYSVCPGYEESVLNRHFFFSTFLGGYLHDSTKKHIIIILNAVNSALSLGLCATNYDKIYHIVEVAKNGMEMKQEMYDSRYPDISDKIKCINADISSTGIMSALNSMLHDFYGNIPFIIVLEGAAFLLQKDELLVISGAFKSGNAQNLIISEYLTPDNSKNLSISTIHALLTKEYLALNEGRIVVPHSHEEISCIIENNGGSGFTRCTMNKMEFTRTGENKFFPADSSGWIECGVWKL